MDEHYAIWRGQYIEERAEILNSKRINNENAIFGANLNKAQLWVIGVFSDELGVIGDNICGGEMLDNFTKGVLVLDKCCDFAWHICVRGNSTQWF